MSWRRFQILVRGMSAQSATVQGYQQEQLIGKKRGPEAIQTPEAAQAAFASIYGSRPKPA